MWPILEPGTPFCDSWHIQLIAEHLEAVTAGEITRLLINLPPRHMKSMLVSIAWPTWEWIKNPHLRYLFASYAESLAIKQSVDRRLVVQSPWYQRLWGDRVRLVDDQNEKAEFTNDQRGSMTAISLSGAATGKGGDRIVVDDPHNPVDVPSDTIREQTNQIFRSVLTTRLDDKRRGAIIVVGQRLHERDVSAYCREAGYVTVCLPAECDTRSTIVFPRTQRRIEREVGDLLWSEREGPDEIAALKRTLGPAAFAAQYQQSPTPREGGLFKRESWRFYDELPPLDEYTQSWDCAFKDGPQHDYVVGLMAGRKGADIYLMDRFKSHVSFTGTCQAIRQFKTRYPQTSAILIEEAANGPAVIETLRHEIPGVLAVPPEGGKFSRAAAAEATVAAGNVYLPRPTTANGIPIPTRVWVPDFIEQLAAFPQGAHDDDVDAFTQLLARFRRRPPPLSKEAMRFILSDHGNQSWPDLRASKKPYVPESWGCPDPRDC
jgi:predicted phage terminase large subunit-like protein